jgi:hypothetical protein
VPPIVSTLQHSKCLEIVAPKSFTYSDNFDAKLKRLLKSMKLDKDFSEEDVKDEIGFMSKESIKEEKAIACVQVVVIIFI